ncbi:MAG TPA: GNAT family N-acetyltransferase [Thermoanaerobaculia bacterium]
MADNSNASDAAALTFRPMERTEEDLRLFHQAFTANESPKSFELLRWQYFEPPAGKLFVDFAVTTGNDPRLAAIYAVFPVAMRVEGNRGLGVQSLNTLTDREFRGKGLFIRLAKSIYERSAQDGVAVVYGFPNGRSVHGFYTKLQWVPLDPMPMMVRPLRLGWVIGRLTRGKIKLPRWIDPPIPRMRPRLGDNMQWRTLTLEQHGEAIEAVWQRFAATISYAVERDKQYLQWRLRRPGASYEIMGLFRDSTLLGYSITAMSGNAGKIMDLLFDPAEADTGRLLLSEAMDRLKRAGCGAVVAWNYDHSPNHRAFRSAGFVTVPQKMIPDELYSGARSLTTPPSAAVADRKSWYVSMLDSDTD